MMIKNGTMPKKEVWDKVSEDYTLEISKEERQYAEEIYGLLLKEGILPPAKILELGSGSGHLSACLAEKGYSVSLLDFSLGALKKSQETFDKYDLKGNFIEGDLFDLGTISEKYDFVWNSGVMEHFDEDNLEKVFTQIYSVMNKKFMFLVPNPDSVSYLLMRYNLTGKGEWGYGQEYLRRNYLDIAKRVGLSGRVVGYAASSISIWHFESTFLTDENREMYSELVNDKIMPTNESYLVAYMVEKNNQIIETDDRAETEKPGVEPEVFFAKSAENFRLKQNITKYKAEIDHYKAESNMLLNANKINENRLNELEVNYNNLYAQLEFERQKYEEEKRDLNNKLEEEKKNNNIILEQNVYLENNIEKVCGDFLPQVINSTSDIGNILNAKWFNRVIAVHAIASALVTEKFINKIKILVKIALRIVGRNYDLLIDKYRMNLKILQHLGNIDNIVRICQTNIRSTERVEITDPDSLSKKGEAYKECIYAEEPLVSVLLPVYNHVEFIIDAIKGVQRQTYSNWELIILNDGSTDGLLDTIKDYNSDPRIKIYTQDNQRLPNGLSNLHNLASGDFITWTSADNIMEEKMLECLVEKLLSIPSAVMVYADVAIIDDKGNYKTNGYREMNRDPELPYIMRLPHCTETLDAEADNFINACFMYRSEAVKALNGLYSADLEGLEDYDFWLRLRTFGKIVHLNNKEPLYRYRVHENTMSEDLLKNRMEEHAKRTQKMIKYSQNKDLFAEKNWNIIINKEASGAKEFEKALIRMNYSYEKNSSKKVIFEDQNDLGSIAENALAVTCNENYYHIFANKEQTLEERVQIYKGYDLNPLAKKVRQTFIQGLFWEYPAEFVGMPVLGCHIDIRKVDVDKTIEFINYNPEILFSFAIMEGTSSKIVEERISEACPNVIFMGEREFGSQMYLYASWDAMFIPPLGTEIDIMPMILLAWGIGKWILVEDGEKKRNLPFVTSYFYGEKLLGIKAISDIGYAENILDSYIEKYSVIGAVQQVLAYLNGIGQDILVERPDFKLQHKERKFPPTLVKKEYNLPSVLKNGYIGIMVDSLDKGGLEQVVALLARKFRARGIPVRILCTCKGGAIAQELLEEEFEVQVFDGDVKKFEAYLENNRPMLINTHFTKKMIESVAKKKIPIIEVIHNMYVFQNEISLKNEKELSECYTKMIAVSSIVKEVYEKKVSDAMHDKIEVIGNAADPTKVVGMSREYMRSILKIPQDSLVFINVSSIDSRKNQMGLLKAFEVFNQTIDKNSYLIIVGNTLSDFYNKAVEDQINTITCKNHIIKLSYHKNVGDLYKVADIFVMQSYYEGWSIAATEALYSGLPLIHTYCGSAKELVDNERNGVVISNPAGDIMEKQADQLMRFMNEIHMENVDELVNAMTKMAMERQAWRRKRGDIASNSILNYNTEKMIDNYIRVFSEVL